MSNVEQKIRAYASPVLLTIVGFFVYRWMDNVDSKLDAMEANMIKFIETQASTAPRLMALEAKASRNEGRIDKLESLYYSQKVYALLPKDIQVPKRKESEQTD